MTSTKKLTRRLRLLRTGTGRVVSENWKSALNKGMSIIFTAGFIGIVLHALLQTQIIKPSLDEYLRERYYVQRIDLEKYVTVDALQEVLKTIKSDVSKTEKSINSINQKLDNFILKNIPGKN